MGFISKWFPQNKFLTAILIFLILFGIYICFLQLGRAPLDNWDEAWYGEVTKQMIKSGNFITPSWNGAPFFEKPPLYMWFSAFWSLFFGLNEFSIRLTSAIAGIIMIAGTLLYTHKKFGFVPAIAAFATLALNNVFIWRVRSGNLDALTALFVFLSFFLILSKSQKRFVWLGICFALLALTKGSLVLFPVSIFILHDLIFRRKTIFKNKFWYILLFAIAIIIPVIWLYIGYKMAGNLFVNSYLSNSDQGEIGLTNFKWDYIMYTYYSLQRRYFYVLILGFLLLLVFLLKRTINSFQAVGSKGKKSNNFTGKAFCNFRKYFFSPRNDKKQIALTTAEYFLLLLFPLSLLVFLSLAEKTNNWYLVPIMPFYSMVIAYAFYEVIKFFRDNIFIKFIILAVVFILSFKTYTVNILPILSTTSASGEAASGKYLDKHAAKSDIIVRLDDLYPSTIYYSNRQVFSSLPSFKTQGVWISRDDLKKLVLAKNQRWIVGTRGAVQDFVKQFPGYPVKIIPINGEETIAKMY